MDLNRVTAFVRVVQDGSFTTAAKSLGVPKSSVSRSVAQLEEDLGIRLLNRTTRKVHPTDAGAAFYDRVSRALHDIDEARATAADTSTQLRGTVRVTAPIDFAVWGMASSVARFAREHPAIHVDLVLTPRVVDLVSEGVDLAIRAGALRDSSLVARKIGSLRSALYATPKYLASRGTPKKVADLASHDCVVFRPASAADRARSTWKLTGRGGHEESVEVKGPLSVDELTFVRAAILADAGIGLVPEFLCAEDERRGLVARVLPEWVLEGAPIHVVYASASFVPQRVVALRERLVEDLGALLRRCEGHRPTRKKG
jgi:DNA-binding transcriptional LysR family regulator